MLDPKIFKDYDIRATIGETLDQDGMYTLGVAFAAYFHPKTVAIGRDMRLSSDEFFSELSSAFIKQGINVIDLGLITTDMSYFAAATLAVDLALMITASHNPKYDNGLKVTLRGANPVSGDTGLYEIRDTLSTLVDPSLAIEPGLITKLDIWDHWVEHISKFIDLKSIKPLKIAVDAGNGMGAVITNHLSKILPLQVTPLYFDLDGNFPNHPAYPLILDNTKALRAEVSKGGYDFGVAWDGDADRVFLVDEQGQFIDGNIFSAMLADYILAEHPREKVIYNAVNGRVVEEVIRSHQGIPIRCRVGHALLKNKMREVDALLVVEHSGHYFFRDNFYSDSGVIALLNVFKIISQTGKRLSEIVAPYRKYPSSGEINFKVPDKQVIMDSIEERYQSTATSIDWLDGVTVWFPDWWFNVRPSNTQPLLRLNLEVNDPTLSLDAKIAEVVEVITTQGGQRVEE